MRALAEQLLLDPADFTITLDDAADNALPRPRLSATPHATHSLPT